MKNLRFLFSGLSIMFTCLLTLISTTPTNSNDCSYLSGGQYIWVCDVDWYDAFCYRCDYGVDEHCDVSGQNPDCLY